MGVLVVAYDIADDRRRIRLHTLLLGYGEAVQESVFECDLGGLTDRQVATLKRRVVRLVRPTVDKVRFYTLCAGCARGIEDESGQQREPAPEVLVV